MRGREEDGRNLPALIYNGNERGNECGGAARLRPPICHAERGGRTTICAGICFNIYIYGTIPGLEMV